MLRKTKINWPTVSFVMATLNAERVLKECLFSIDSQDYPKDKIEIVVGDGGSTDKTIELAKKHGARVFHNPLKTAESGKMRALNETKGQFIVIIDSDNILPSRNWIKRMIKPLMENTSALGSEPWKYVWRKEDGFIDRYCALIGMNDPFVHFLGNYDRMNLLTGTWTEVQRDEKDMGDYLLVRFEGTRLPTIGANGTVFRADYLKEEAVGDYLFDIDILAKTLKRNGQLEFIKVKNGIIHLYCGSDILKFKKKQRRRVRDYLYHQGVAKDRDYIWEEMDISGSTPWGLLMFIFSCVSVLPLFIQTFRGYQRKPDLAWFFHPLACEITLWEYGWGRLLGFFGKKELSRENWSQ